MPRTFPRKNRATARRVESTEKLCRSHAQGGKALGVMKRDRKVEKRHTWCFLTGLRWRVVQVPAQIIVKD